MIGNIKALVKACEGLNIPHVFLDENKNLVKVMLANKPHYFANASVPLNSDSFSRITADKEFTYKILKSVVNMPKTLGFVDPFMEGRFTRYIKYKSYEDITVEISKSFNFPLVLKPNSKQEGLNVCVVNSTEEVTKHLGKIFNQSSKHYDFIALAQEKIDTDSEYRAFVLNNKIELVESRTGNGSKLSSHLKTRIETFVEPIFDLFELGWGGVDIALDKLDKLWVFELNTRPGFSSTSKEKVQLYRKLLESLGS